MIDWQQQWAFFAPRFVDGKAHISLPNGAEVQLLPGPGFGDFSHPTTQLMVSLMEEHVPNRVVFDIGCGSGILSVAAAKMGAKKVYACDIDAQAIAHTEKNGQLNGVNIDFSKPTGKPVVLMNMISSEQDLAWKSHGCPFEILICSGILLADKDNYMEFVKSNSWMPIHEEESQGWLGMVFKREPL
jgi:ribosomal protein L11 methyltransferase